MTTKATSEMAPESQNFMDKFPDTIWNLKSYGNWALGCGWVSVTPPGSNTEWSGLAIYARLHMKDPVKCVVVRMRDAMAFAVANKIPARPFGKFIAEAITMGVGFDPRALVSIKTHPSETHLSLGDRHFYVFTDFKVQLPGVRGPWAIIENNGGGMKPLVHREGISGSRSNAIRVLRRYVESLEVR